MRRVEKVFLSLELLMLFTMYQVSITMFTHVHYVNGVMITHSHPGKGKHTHTKTAIVVIARLSVLYLLEAGEPVKVEPVRPLLCYVELQATAPVVTGTNRQVVSLRAPPMI